MHAVAAHRLLGMLTGAALLLAGCATVQKAPGPNDVVIEEFAFKVQEITVSPGTEVVWTNRQIIPHTVTAVNKSFDSGTMGYGNEFKRKFDTPGTYDYVCAIHPSMKGKVIVK